MAQSNVAFSDYLPPSLSSLFNSTRQSFASSGVPLGACCLAYRFARMVSPPLIAYTVALFATQLFLYQSSQLASNSNGQYALLYRDLSSRFITQLRAFHAHYPYLFRIACLLSVIFAYFHILTSIALAASCGFLHAVILYKSP